MPAGHPVGKGWPFANLVTVVGDVAVVPEPEPTGPWEEDPVHAASATSIPAVSRDVVARIDLIRSAPYAVHLPCGGLASTSAMGPRSTRRIHASTIADDERAPAAASS